MSDKRIIDLSGPDGNAFVLLVYAKTLAKQLQFNNDDTEAILADMQSSNYKNLCEVFKKHFGDYITFINE